MELNDKIKETMLRVIVVKLVQCCLKCMPKPPPYHKYRNVC